ncbi:hypothetical protein Hdeb2414_s0875g00956661 [Helianthus debilis subsp. tardiflorus]
MDLVGVEMDLVYNLFISTCFSCTGESTRVPCFIISHLVESFEYLIFKYACILRHYWQLLFFCYIYIVEINLQFTHQGSFTQGMNFVNSQVCTFRFSLSATFLNTDSYTLSSIMIL